MSTHVYFIELFYQKGLPGTVRHQGQYRQWLRNAGMLLAERVTGQRQGCLLAVDDNGSVLKGLTGSSEDAAPRFTAYGHGAWYPSACTLAGFKGERLDPLTRGYLLGNGYRLHAPTLMRFGAPDSLSPFYEGGLNAYAYCGCDPINHEDPSGHAFGFKTRTRGYRTSFNTALRRRPAVRIDIPGKLASHAELLINKVLDNLPSSALENLSKASPALEPIIAKRSSKNLDVFMQTSKFEGLQPAIENPPLGVRQKEASERLQAQISRNVRHEVGTYLGLFNNVLNDLPATGRKIRDT